LDDNDKSRKKEDNRAERYRKEGDKIEKGDNLQEGQHKSGRELLVAEDREPMHQKSVIAEPENEINEDSERRCNQGGHGTGIGCLIDDAKEALCYH